MIPVQRSRDSNRKKLLKNNKTPRSYNHTKETYKYIYLKALQLILGLLKELYSCEIHCVHLIYNKHLDRGVD